jgi:hypothetical protein
MARRNSSRRLRDRAVAAVDVHDPAVAAFDEVIDGQRHALRVRGPHGINSRVVDAPYDEHQRDLARQRRLLGVRADHDQGVETEVLQTLHRPRLAATVGQSAQDQLVAPVFGRVVEPVENVKVEGSGHPKTIPISFD